ncbi:MAG: amidase [Candidatus Acidiferrales bacterium]|jgi:aspartyl-tRNA(Asn)/glutamyl-tRNA(Gln) amidotransferase subunit A
MISRPESELAFLSIQQAARLLRRKEISPLELVNVALARIEHLNPSINAFLTVLADRARKKARAAELEFVRTRRGSAAKLASPLFGIPVSLKDNFWTRGIRTTAGSKILGNFIPNEDSDVAARLVGAGAILLGKTNMHEFAYGISNQNPHYGAVHNPWALDRISGGSSGGSAAAIAAGMCFASVGTDTGGSIRIPAALCGIVGLKPTYGLVSVAGVIPLARSLDHAGPLARNVVDVSIMLQAIAGKYPKATTPPDSRKLKRDRSQRFRLGWPREYFFERVDPEIQSAIKAAAKVFVSTGARFEDVSLPHLGDSLDPSTNIALSEATRYHQSQGFYPARAAEYGADVSSRLEMGTQVRAVDYLRAFEVKRQMESDFEAAFERVDAILAPAVPIAAPRIGEDETKIAGEDESVRSALVRLNRPANLTGHPAISIPCGFTRGGLPIGLQLIGPRWAEASLLAIAHTYEDATEWHTRHPEFAVQQ